MQFPESFFLRAWGNRDTPASTPSPRSRHPTPHRPFRASACVVNERRLWTGRTRRVPQLVSAEVQILHAPLHQLSDRLPQLLGSGAAYEVPAVEDPVDRQVRKQGEGERDGQRAVNLVGSLADAELVGEQQVLVAQEAVACSQTGLEGGLDRRRVDRDDRDPTVGDFSGLMELDQLPQLDLSLGSPGPAIEGENERAAVGHLFDRHLLPAVIDQGHGGELLTDFAA